ncbi:MAG: M20 family metallopeptidase [Clostridiales bacterium]|nr:M20 family metallopeptidase [Clostridiales bacterium]
MRLIELPSTTPPIHVMPVVEALTRFAREIGAEAALQEVQPGKPNCILTFDLGGSKTLVLNTHMDVNNPSGQVWRNDPFVPYERANRIYGLGACDAKGSLAAMLEALESVCRSRNGLCGRVILTAVMGEEAGGIGSLHLCNAGLKADGAIVGEPTELALCTVHKGTYMRRVTFKGSAVHSARSRAGVNAIDHAVSFCYYYQQLQKRLEAFPHPILGPADASVTLISGGTRQNTIPESCSVLIDRRLIPGETHTKADRELEEILTRLRGEIPAMRVEVETVVATVPSETDASQSIVQCALDAIRDETQRSVSPTGFCGGCDMSKLVNISGIPTAIFGPGSMENAHSPDEFVDIEQLESAARIYERIIRNFLKEQKEHQ